VSSKETKTASIMLRVTPSQKAAIERRAMEVKLDKSKYLLALFEKDLVDQIIPTPKPRRLILKKLRLR
jgi:hypothetical protein